MTQGHEKQGDQELGCCFGQLNTNDVASEAGEKAKIRRAQQET
jgi:hypothetical protein